MYVNPLVYYVYFYKYGLVLIVTHELQAEIQHGKIILKELKQHNGVGVILSIHLQYLHQYNIVVEEHCDRGKHDVLKYMKVGWKKYNMVNSIDQ